MRRPTATETIARTKRLIESAIRDDDGWLGAISEANDADWVVAPLDPDTLKKGDMLVCVATGSACVFEYVEDDEIVVRYVDTDGFGQLVGHKPSELRRAFNEGALERLMERLELDVGDVALNRNSMKRFRRRIKEMLGSELLTEGAAPVDDPGAVIKKEDVPGLMANMKQYKDEIIAKLVSVVKKYAARGLKYLIYAICFVLIEFFLLPVRAFLVASQVPSLAIFTTGVLTIFIGTIAGSLASVFVATVAVGYVMTHAGLLASIAATFAGVFGGALGVAASFTFFRMIGDFFVEISDFLNELTDDAIGSNPLLSQQADKFEAKVSAAISRGVAKLFGIEDDGYFG